MTTEERIKRYKTIIKWGARYAATLKGFVIHKPVSADEYDKQLLEEYEKTLKDLQEQQT